MIRNSFLLMNNHCTALVSGLPPTFPVSPHCLFPQTSFSSETLVGAGGGHRRFVLIPVHQTSEAIGHIHATQVQRHVKKTHKNNHQFKFLKHTTQVLIRSANRYAFCQYLIDIN